MTTLNLSSAPLISLTFHLGLRAVTKSGSRMASAVSIPRAIVSAPMSMLALLPGSNDVADATEAARGLSLFGNGGNDGAAGQPLQ